MNKKILIFILSVFLFTLPVNAERTRTVFTDEATGTNIGIGTSVPTSLLHVGGESNYLAVQSDGEILLHGTARTTNGLWVPASGLKAPGAKPATYVEHGLNGAWQFANQAVEVNQETVSGMMRIPERMDRTVPITFIIGWSSDGISPGNCKWQLEYLWTASNEDTTAGAQETLTTVSTASATSNGLVVAEITGIDMPSATDVCFHLRITRLSADGQDTIAGTVEGLGICASFTADKLGT